MGDQHHISLGPPGAYACGWLKQLCKVAQVLTAPEGRRFVNIISRSVIDGDSNSAQLQFLILISDLDPATHLFLLIVHFILDSAARSSCLPLRLMLYHSAWIL